MFFNLCPFYLAYNFFQILRRPQLELADLPSHHPKYIQNFIGARYEEGHHLACYVPSIDKIFMPHKEQFLKQEQYYSTYFHELTHWSGHNSRLNRGLGESTSRFSETYAFEELVAELGAAFLCNYTGISEVHPRESHAKYLKYYIEMLKENSRQLVFAASKASDAFEFILEEVENNSAFFKCNEHYIAS